MDEIRCSTAPSPNRSTGLCVAAWFVALSACGGAIGLVGGGLSFGARLDQRLPFASPVLAGIALALLVAVPFTILAVRAWRGSHLAGATAIVAGAMLLAWIVVQLLFLREFSWFHPLYAAIGAAFVVVGRRERARHAPSVDVAAVERFLAHQRIVVVGATDDPKKFGSTVCRELMDHGHDVVPVNPKRSTVYGIDTYRDVRSVPGEIDAAMVVLTGPAAVDAVRDLVLRSVPRVWLFRGAGSPGAWSAEAEALCRANGIEVVAGACPLMFLGPVTGAHHAHLAVRRFAGSVG